MRVQIRTPDGGIYKPLPKQAAFHSSPAQYLAYVGGFGSGKTVCGCAEGIMLTLETPNNLGLVGRKIYRELKATTQETFLSMIPKEAIKSFNRSTGELEAWNGSKVLFWNLQDPETFKSLNLGWWHLDEGSELEETILLMLKGRLRRHVPRPRGFLTTNPNGRDYIYKWFVQKGIPSHVLIHAPTTENPYLPEWYINDLRATYPEEWLARFMEGSFDVFEGQVYPEWDERVHVFPEGYEDWYPDREWVHLRLMDWGWQAPTCVLLASVDPHGNLYVWEELYRPHMKISEIAERTKEISRDYYFAYNIIDSACMNSGPNGRSIADELAEDHGLVYDPAQKSIQTGILKVREFLKHDPAHRNPFTGLSGAPRLFVHRRCVNLRNEFPQYQWRAIKTGEELKKKGEEPIGKNDHALDPLRYGVMACALAPRVRTDEGEYERGVRLMQEALGRRRDAEALGVIRSHGEETGSQGFRLPEAFLPFSL